MEPYTPYQNHPSLVVTGSQQGRTCWPHRVKLMSNIKPSKSVHIYGTTKGINNKVFLIKHVINVIVGFQLFSSGAMQAVAICKVCSFLVLFNAVLLHHNYYYTWYNFQHTVFTIYQKQSLHTISLLLNQVRPSLRLACTWFLKILSVWTSVCVCVPPTLLITSGVM